MSLIRRIVGQNVNNIDIPSNRYTTDPLRALPNQPTPEEISQRLNAAQIAAAWKAKRDLAKGRVAKRLRFQDRDITRLPSAVNDPNVVKGQLVGPPTEIQRHPSEIDDMGRHV
jgi:hypothetical protein